MSIHRKWLVWRFYCGFAAGWIYLLTPVFDAFVFAAMLAYLRRSR